MLVIMLFYRNPAIALRYCRPKLIITRYFTFSPKEFCCCCCYTVLVVVVVLSITKLLLTEKKISNDDFSCILFLFFVNFCVGPCPSGRDLKVARRKTLYLFPIFPIRTGTEWLAIFTSSYFCVINSRILSALKNFFFLPKKLHIQNLVDPAPQPPSFWLLHRNY